MGKDGIVDLKITDYYNDIIIASPDTFNRDKGYLTENEMAGSIFIDKAEMSYHRDGSFLHKIKYDRQDKHFNPYGEGKRWTATNEIDDFQPILYVAIRRMAIYNKSSEYPILKSKETDYICENDDLFEENGQYLVILYIRNKKLPVNCFTTSKVYSDIITQLNEELDLCIFIQRHSYPIAVPYYSEHFKCMITPYLNNSINFCNNESAKDEMKIMLRDIVFNLQFNCFLDEISGKKLINFTEDKLQLIDQIDYMYKKYGERLPVGRAFLIKFALNNLGDRLAKFNKLPLSIKHDLILEWMNELVEGQK